MFEVFLRTKPNSKLKVYGEHSLTGSWLRATGDTELLLQCASEEIASSPDFRVTGAPKAFSYWDGRVVYYTYKNKPLVTKFFCGYGQYDTISSITLEAQDTNTPTLIEV